MRSARTTDAELLPLFGKPGLVYSGANCQVQRKLDGASLVPSAGPPGTAGGWPRTTSSSTSAGSPRTEKLGKAQPIGWTFAGKPSQRGPADDKAASKVGNDTSPSATPRTATPSPGAAQRYVDGDNDAVTRADNVVIMRVRNVPDGNRDVLGSASVLSKTVGRGKVTLYRDGVKIDGTWSRSKASAPLRFTDPSGKDDRPQAGPDLGHAAGLRPGHAGRARVVHRFLPASVCREKRRVTLVAHRSRRSRCPPLLPTHLSAYARSWRAARPQVCWRAAEPSPWSTPTSRALDLTGPRRSTSRGPAWPGVRATVVRARWTARPRSGLPDAGEWSAALVLAVVQALLAQRPIAQLNRWLADDVLCAVSPQQRQHRTAPARSGGPGRAALGPGPASAARGG